jgi:hypothetical protein
VEEVTEGVVEEVSEAVTESEGLAEDEGVREVEKLSIADTLNRVAFPPTERVG